MKNSIIGKLQLLISAAAVILIAALAFTPLLNITLESNTTIYENSLDRVLNLAIEKEFKEITSSDLSSEEQQEAQKAVSERYAEMVMEIIGVNEDGEENIDTHISLSVIGIAENAGDAVKFVQYWIKAIEIDTMYELAKSADGGVDEETANRIGELENELRDEIDPDAVNIDSIRIFRLFFNGFLSSIDIANIEEDTAFKLASVSVLTALKLAILVAVFIFFPLSMLLSVVGLVLSLLSSKRYNKVQKKCKKAIVWIGTLLLAVVVCGAELSATGVIVVLAAAAAVVINLLASRFKSYTKGERKFLNVMQISAIISTAGIVTFAIFLAKADLLSFYTSAELSAQVSVNKTEPQELAMTLGIFAGMGALTVVVLKKVFKSAMKLITRAACMGGGGGNGLGTAIAGALLVLLNNYLLDMYDITLSSAQNDAMDRALIGIILVLVGAISFKVLGVIFAHGTTREEKRAVMSGSSVGDEEDD